MAQETLKAVILTALRVEYQAVRAFLSNCEEDIHPFDGTVYERGEFVANDKTWEIGIVEIGPGNVDAGIETNRAALRMPELEMWLQQRKFMGTSQGRLKPRNLRLAQELLKALMRWYSGLVQKLASQIGELDYQTTPIEDPKFG